MSDILQSISLLQNKTFIKSSDPKTSNISNGNKNIKLYDDLITDTLIPNNTDNSMMGNTQSNILYCDTCTEYYTSSKSTHYMSIAHNLKLNTKNNYTLTSSNIGYQILKKSGWDEISGLGSNNDGMIQPVATVLKQNKLGLGAEKLKSKITHFSSQPDSGPLTVAASAAVDSAARSYFNKHGRYCSQQVRVIGSGTINEGPKPQFILNSKNLINRKERRLRDKRIANLEKTVDALIKKSVEDLGRP